MESAISGLIGVILGALITLTREWWLQRIRNRKDVEFLAVQVLGQLDRYVVACANVVADDGLCEGQRDERGYLQVQVATPRFEPDHLKVEWKSLPVQLMYEILDLPYRAEIADHRVTSVFEFAATPPDFDEGFEERQYQYAILGSEAADIAERLRSHAKLSARPRGEWDPVAYMEDEKSKITLLRQAHVAQIRSGI